jgi:hypothetical protein
MGWFGHPIFSLGGGWPPQLSRRHPQGLVWGGTIATGDTKNQNFWVWPQGLAEPPPRALGGGIDHP